MTEIKVNPFFYIPSDLAEWEIELLDQDRADTPIFNSIKN